MKRILSEIFRYGIIRRLRRGGRLQITPSWKCNYNCSYCSLRVNGVYPKSKTLPLKDWKNKIEQYESAIKASGGLSEILLAGGEPTLLPYFEELVNWILFEKKWHLMVFTNLSNLKWLKIKQSPKLLLIASCHNGVNIDAFTKRYKKINKMHRTIVYEIGDKKLLRYSKLKPFLTEKEIKTVAENIRLAPDLKLYLNCHDMSVPFV